MDNGQNDLMSRIYSNDKHELQNRIVGEEIKKINSFRNQTFEQIRNENGRLMSKEPTPMDR